MYTVTLARKPGKTTSIFTNLMEHGVGALNIGSVRIPLDPNHDPVRGTQRRVGKSAYQRYGEPAAVTHGVEGQRQLQFEMSGSVDAGRWPTNCILVRVSMAVEDPASDRFFSHLK